MEIACPNSPGEGSNFMGLWTDCAIKRAFFSPGLLVMPVMTI